MDGAVISKEIKNRRPRSKVSFAYHFHLNLSNGRNTYKQQQYHLGEITIYN